MYNFALRAMSATGQPDSGLQNQRKSQNSNIEKPLFIVYSYVLSRAQVKGPAAFESSP